MTRILCTGSLAAALMGRIYDMLKHMRTTINLPDDLILQAKKAALDADTTLTEIIGNALREALAKRKNGKPRSEFKVNASGHGGLQPGVDLDDTSALLDIMDGLNDSDRR
jgi:hypothetical protein